jgi:hypothetical protein
VKEKDDDSRKKIDELDIKCAKLETELSRMTH